MTTTPTSARTGRRTHRARYLLAAGAVVAGSCGVLAAGGLAASSSDDTVELLLGDLNDLTGGASYVGQGNSNALQIFADEVNAAGGVVVGDTVYLLAFQTEDSKSDPSGAVAAYRKLRSSGVNFIFGPTSGGVTPAVLPLIDADSGVIVFPLTTLNDITDGERIVRPAPEVASWDTTLSEFLIGRSYGTVAYLTDQNNAAYLNAQPALVEAVEAAGTVTVAQEYMKVGDTDFSAQLTKIASLEPDALVLRAYLGEIVAIQRKVRELGIEADIIWEAAAHSSDIVQLIEPAEMEGVINCRGLDLETAISGGSAIAQQLDETMLERYGIHASNQSFAAWDSMAVFVAAVQQAESVEPDAVLAALLTLAPDDVETIQRFTPTAAGTILDETGQSSTPGSCTPWDGEAWGAPL